MQTTEQTPLHPVDPVDRLLLNKSDNNPSAESNRAATHRVLSYQERRFRELLHYWGKDEKRKGEREWPRGPRVMPRPPHAPQETACCNWAAAAPATQASWTRPRRGGRPSGPGSTVDGKQSASKVSRASHLHWITGQEATARKYVFDATSVGQRSSPWPCKLSERDNVKFCLECKFRFLCAQFIMRQMHWTVCSDRG